VIGIVAALFLLTTAAQSRLQETALENVGASPPPNAQLPTASPLADENGVTRTLGDAMAGRPSLFVLADYACKTLCGPVLAFVGVSLEQSGLKPGQDYRLVAIGLSPHAREVDAREMKRAQLGDGPLARATSFLIADQTVLAQITSLLGYSFAYDAENDQFAHPAALFVLTADGHVVRTLSGLGVDPADLRLALVEAGEGRIGGVADRVRLLCYGFDPAVGIYTLSIERLLALMSLITAIALAGMIGLLARKETRQP
jgi:protein SCO1/2